MPGFVLASDLHLEFIRDPKNIPDVTGAGGDTLILAGDICVASSLGQKDKVKHAFFESCAGYRNVLYIMGNHEHYHGLFGNTADILRRWLERYPNVRLMDNDVAEIDGVRVFGGTVWTDVNRGDPLSEISIRQNMSDFESIKIGKKTLFNPPFWIGQHEIALAAIDSFLAVDGPKVLATHHSLTGASVPDRFNRPENYRDNAGYRSERDDLLSADTGLQVAAHGHMHDNVDVMLANGVRLLCNPRGYDHHSERHRFAGWRPVAFDVPTLDTGTTPPLQQRSTP